MQQPEKPLQAAGRRMSMRQREAVMGYLFIAPALIGLVVFYVLPTLRAAQISLTDWNLLRAPRWVGLSNYEKLWADDTFWESLRLTLLYVAYNIPLQTALALFIAVLADRLARQVWVRAVMIAPYLISNVVAGLVWLLMLDPLIGMTNVFIETIGAAPQPFLASPDQALISVAGINIWRHVASRRCCSTPACRPFRATCMRRRGWTVPANGRCSARSPCRFCARHGLRAGHQRDRVLPDLRHHRRHHGGGPAGSTKVVMFYIYETAFKFSNMGLASAMSMVLFVILIAVTLVQMRAMRAGQSDLG